MCSWARRCMATMASLSCEYGGGDNGMAKLWDPKQGNGENQLQTRIYAAMKHTCSAIKKTICITLRAHLRLHLLFPILHRLQSSISGRPLSQSTRLSQTLPVWLHPPRPPGSFTRDTRLTTRSRI